MRLRPLIMALALVVSLLATGCNQVNARKAVKTNDAIISLQHDMKFAQEAFFDVLTTQQDDQIAAALERLKTAAETGRRACAEHTVPDCGKDFLVAAARMFRHYELASGAEYRQIAAWYSRDSVTTSEWSEIERIVKEAGEQEMQALQVFREAQVGFAEACGFQLADNED